jgi:hypothetical protein
MSNAATKIEALAQARAVGKLTAGMYVIIHNLLTHTKFNGRRAVLVAYLQTKGRWQVKFVDGGSSICVKNANLIAVAEIQQVHMYIFLMV